MSGRRVVAFSVSTNMATRARVMAAERELSRSKFIERALALYMELTERGYIDPKTGLIEPRINKILKISVQTENSGAR